MLSKRARFQKSLQVWEGLKNLTRQVHAFRVPVSYLSLGSTSPRVFVLYTRLLLPPGERPPYWQFDFALSV